MYIYSTIVGVSLSFFLLYVCRSFVFCGFSICKPDQPRLSKDSPIRHFTPALGILVTLSAANHTLNNFQGFCLPTSGNTTVYVYVLICCSLSCGIQLKAGLGKNTSRAARAAVDERVIRAYC